MKNLLACAFLAASLAFAHDASLHKGKATEGEIVSKQALPYINRLSDHLFVASRFLNRKEQGDVLWVPGQNR